MHITRIDLENVKSYRQAQITFKRGTNAICGQNGAGKSTILEAIGFALFDYSLPFTQSDFVREGEKTATVTLHVVDREEREYQIVRKCGSYGQYYVYDPELDERITENKGDTVEWLCDFLGVDPSTDLTALFEDAVGVPQGKLTAAFLDPPSRRKDVFNPLLRVDEYEEVWNGLRETGRWLDEQISERENQIAGLEGELKVLPERRTKAETLAREIAGGEEKQAELESELGDVSTRKADLEEIKARLDALDKAVTEARSQVETLTARLEDAEEAVEAARRAQEILQETASGFEAYERAKAALQELETRREERDRLRKELQECEQQSALAHQEKERLEIELKEIVEAEAELERLRPQVEQQEALESALQTAKRDATRLEDIQKSLEREQARLRDLREQMNQIQVDLEERRTLREEIEMLEGKGEALEARRESLREKIGDLEAQAAQLEERHAQAVKTQASAQAELQKARAEAAQLERRLADLRQGVAERRDLEARIAAYRESLAAADADYEALSAKIVERQTRLKQVGARMDALTTTDDEAACPVCEQALTPEHRLELVERYEKERATLKAELAEFQAERAVLEEKRRALSTSVTDWAVDLETLPRPQEAKELAERLERQQQVVAAQQQALDEARKNQAAVETEQQSVSTTLEQQREILDEVKTELMALEGTLEEKRARLETLPRPAQAVELQTEIEKEGATVAELEAEVETLSEAPGVVERLQAGLEALGDPRREHQRAEDVAAQRGATEQELAETTENLEALKAEQGNLNEALAAYADLDAEFAAQRVTQAAHEAAHQRYVAHRREAEALEKRVEAAELLRLDLREAEANREKIREERETAAEEYDAEAYTALEEQQKVLQKDLGAVEADLRQWNQQLADLQAEIARLETTQAEMESVREAHAEQTDLRGLLQYLRRVLRDAGPEITRQLVELISLQADRLYSEIMQDHTVRLRWAEDYGIVLSQEGRERSFAQLSGGEQMAAALAVRLGLLRQVSAINLAFFDEPTANLDEQRRDNLAEQILDIKGFAQLFVISHDDTFEQDTDHVIRVVKEDGASHIGPELGMGLEG